jgi:sterol carrier protein 2
MQSDTESTFTTSAMNLTGADMAKRAAIEVYTKTGIKPSQIDVVELHDCFSTNELILYEQLGLCETGKGGEAVDQGIFDYGGRCVVCPSGGLLSKGHPIGASGIAQCAELCWQLRGMAEKRQVKDPKYALQHTVGLGGACVVAMYKKLKPGVGFSRPDQTSDPEKLQAFE